MKKGGIKMKGIILAGGSGSRLEPMTKVTNKHLLPVYDKPMIYYPIETFTKANIKDILIVTGAESAGDFINLLGDGSEFGVNFTYRLQKGSGGIAEALRLGRNFMNSPRDALAVILGDNIFEDDFSKEIREYDKEHYMAKVFLKEVKDPERFGVASIKDDRITKIVEKPKKPETNLAVTGLYLYNGAIWHVIDNLKPSHRNELEITDVNNWYVDKGLMTYEYVKGFWSDAGTPESLHFASSFVKSKKK